MCLDCCFKGKCWCILKVISFIYIYIHVILTYLVKVNVGGMKFIYISSPYRAVFIVFDSEKDSQTDNLLTLQGKSLVTMIDNTKNDTRCLQR